MSIHSDGRRLLILALLACLPLCTVRYSINSRVLNEFLKSTVHLQHIDLILDDIGHSPIFFSYSPAESERLFVALRLLVVVGMVDGAVGFCSVCFFCFPFYLILISILLRN